MGLDRAIVTGPGRTPGTDADAAYAELHAYLAARDDADGAVAGSMRSQLVRGRPGGGVVILVHGLTASPPAWRAMTAALAAAGRTVVVPRLLLHGYADRMTPALRDLHPDALIEDLSAIVGAVGRLGEDITLAGHSLGATLAIDAALRTPAVARIVAVAPFLGIANVPHEIHPLLVGVMQRVPDMFLWWDPVVRERLAPAHGYPRYPLRALVTGLRIADGARASADRPPHARAIDVVLNERETSVNNRTALHLARRWRTAGASVAVHVLHGLAWSHDIIEPERSAAQNAHATLVGIIGDPHVAGDRRYDVG